MEGFHQGRLDSPLLEAADAGSASPTASLSPKNDRLRKGTVFSSIINLASTILGASTLSMSSACSNLGIGLYIALLVLVGFIAERSLVMLVRCGILMGRARVSYSEIGGEAAGKFGRYAVIASVSIQQLGACIAFIQIIGDVLSGVVRNIPNHVVSQPCVPFPLLRVCTTGLLFPQTTAALCVVSVQGLGSVFWQLLVTVVIIFPLCLLRFIDSLKFSSTASVTLIIFFALIVCIDGLSRAAPSSHPPDVSMGPADLKDAVVALSVISFGYVCHMNVFPVMSELKDFSYSRMAIVSKGAVAIAGGLYVAVGTLGYVVFGSHVQSDIIKSYQDMQTHDSSPAHPGKDSILVPATVVKVLQFGIGIALTFSFPVVFYELRHSVEILLFPHDTHAEPEDAGEGKPRPKSAFLELGEDAVSVDSSVAPSPVPGMMIESSPHHAINRSAGAEDQPTSSASLNHRASSSHRAKPFSWIRHVLLVAGLLVVVVLVAIFVDNIGIVLGFTGATMSCLVVFILPAFFFLRLDDGPATSLPHIGATLQLIFGVLLVPIGVVAQVLQITSGKAK